MNEKQARKSVLRQIRRDIGHAKSMRLRIATAKPVEALFLPSTEEVEGRIAQLKGTLEAAKTADPKVKWISWDREGNSYSQCRKAHYFEVGTYASRLFGTWGI